MTAPKCMYVAATLLLCGACVGGAPAEPYRAYDDFVALNEYDPELNALVTAYNRGVESGRSAPYETRYAGLRAAKRNADIINSLLALPKNMNDAGR